MKRKISFSVALIVLAQLAIAQQPLETSGTIDATLGGQERVWHMVITEAPGVRVNTANWSFFDYSTVKFHTITLTGYPGAAVTLDDVQTYEGRLELTFMFSDGLPSDCPCAVEASITYSASDSISKDKYLAEEAPVTLTTFRSLDERTFAMAGDFTATLAFQKDSLSDPDPDNTLDIGGRFEATVEPAGNQAR